jgi:hypothetical protein
MASESEDDGFESVISAVTTEKPKAKRKLTPAQLEQLALAREKANAVRKRNAQQRKVQKQKEQKLKDFQHQREHVLAGFSFSNVDELIQRIKACDIKNCFRLPQTALGRASEQPDYFVERSPPAPPAPSPPAALPSARATNEMAQSVFDSVMELQGEEIYS